MLSRKSARVAAHRGHRSGLRIRNVAAGLIAFLLGGMLGAPSASADTTPDPGPLLADLIPIYAASNIAIDESANRGYVTDFSQPVVHVFDGETRRVTHEIPYSSDGVAVNESAGRIYLTAADSNAVRVIDSTTYDLVDTILLGDGTSQGSHSIKFNKTSNIIFVTNNSTSPDRDPSSNAIYLVDGETHEVRESIVLPSPTDISIDESAGRVFVLSVGHSRVSILDLTTLEVEPIELTRTYLAMAFDDMTGELYLASSDGTVTVMNTDTLEASASLSLGHQPRQIAVDSTSGRVYVAHHFDQSVSVIDGTAKEVIKKLPLEGSPMGITVDTSRNIIYTTITNNARGVAVLTAPTAPGIESIALPDGFADSFYQTVLYASGAERPTFSITGGSLPSGFEIDPVFGVIRGTSETQGTSTFEVTATNSSGTDSAIFTITIDRPVEHPANLTHSIPEATVGDPYSVVFEMSGYPTPTISLWTGELPPGLSLDSDTGELSGIPESAGTYHFGVGVSNIRGTGYSYYDLSVVSPFLTSPTPVIAGSPHVGSLLTVNTGNWAPEPESFEIQWLRDGAAIEGATAAHYDVAPSDLGGTISVNVTARRTGFTTTTRTSTAAGPVTPGLLSAPEHPNVVGTLTEGDLLTVEVGTWGPVPIAYTYQWSRDGVPVVGATDSTYLLTASDVGKAITVSVTGSKVGYTSLTRVSVPTTHVLARPPLPNARFAGPDRFSTAVSVSRENYSPGVDVVYIANGRDFPDALAGAPVAGRDNGPVLLVRADAIPTTVTTELKRLKPQRIVILGGTGVISQPVERALKTHTTGAVSRLAGADRFSTAVSVSRENYSPGVDVVYIANGRDFPDALAGAPVAGRDNGPVLLVRADAIPTTVTTELKRLKPQRIVILGGTGVISQPVERALNAYTTQATG